MIASGRALEEAARLGGTAAAWVGGVTSGTSSGVEGVTSGASGALSGAWRGVSSGAARAGSAVAAWARGLLGGGGIVSGTLTPLLAPLLQLLQGWQQGCGSAVSSAAAEALLRLHGLGGVTHRLCHAGLEAARAALAGFGGGCFRGAAA